MTVGGPSKWNIRERGAALRDPSFTRVPVPGGLANLLASQEADNRPWEGHHPGWLSDPGGVISQGGQATLGGS